MKMYKSDFVFVVLDIEKLVEFYENKLGFKWSWCDVGYGIVNRDDIGIYFWCCDNKIFFENISCYVYVQDVDSFYKEY